MVYKDTISKLKSDGALFRCQGIIDCLEEKILDSEVMALVSSLRNDKVIILGRRISSYALAALDILGVEAYEGNNIEVIELILELRKCFP